MALATPDWRLCRTVIFTDGKESDRRGKNDEIDKKTKCGKKHQAKEQQLGLYPGLSVSCDDICGRFCNERSLSFWENSALVVDGVHQYTAFYKELLSQLEKGAGWTYSTHSMGYDFLRPVLLLSQQSVQPSCAAVYEIHVCK